MTVSHDYRALAEALQAAAATFQGPSSRASAEWTDSLGREVMARLDEAAGRGAGVALSVADQAEEHRRLNELAELVERHSHAVRERVDASTVATRSGLGELRDAEDLHAEAIAAARASANAVEKALQVASRAGAECGKAVSFGNLEGMVQQQVVQARQAEVARMAAKAVGREAAGLVVGEVAQQALGIPEGAVPEHHMDQLADSVRDAGEITRARVQRLIKRLPKQDRD